MVIDVGVGTEGVRWAVRALLDHEYLLVRRWIEDMQRIQKETYNSLQKSIAFTPRAPSAGPTGGDGVAFPAGTTIFYSMCQPLSCLPR